MNRRKTTTKLRDRKQLIPQDGPYLVYVPGWTEERYFAEAPESQFVEFVDGELIVPSPVSIRHQKITLFLTMLLGMYVETRKLGEVYNGPAVARLRPDLNYEPDIFVVATEQLPQLEEQYFSGAPALVVEVISGGTRNYDLRVKAPNYRQYGVPEYWVIDPVREQFFQHLLPDEPAAPYAVTEFSSGRVESRAVPGFWIDVSWLWAEPLPATTECLRELLPA